MACSNAFGMEQNEEKTDLNTPQLTVEVNPNFKQDLIKGAAGLATAGVFGYLSMHCSQKTQKAYGEKHNNFDIFTDNLYKYTGEKLLKLFPESSIIKYCRTRIGIVGNTLIAFQCAKYGANKLSSVIADKTPASFKQRLSSIRSTISSKVQNNWKRPFSGIGSYLKSKTTTSKKVSTISNFDSQIAANT